jgi:hypothetical protein
MVIQSVIPSLEGDRGREDGSRSAPTKISETPLPQISQTWWFTYIIPGQKFKTLSKK